MLETFSQLPNCMNLPFANIVQNAGTLGVDAVQKRWHG